MILCIEHYLGNTLLSGSPRPRRTLLEELTRVESLYDRNTDNFVPLLCRLYGWEPARICAEPDYTYDRDTGLLLPLGKF